MLNNNIVIIINIVILHKDRDIAGLLQMKTDQNQIDQFSNVFLSSGLSED